MMLPGGNYKINNVYFAKQFADMKDGDFAPGTMVVGHHEDDTTAGINHRTFTLDVKPGVERIGILKNISSGTYATINKDKGVVEGSPIPQELQFTDWGNGRWAIHLPDQDIVWVLEDDKDFTQISAVPAPPDGQQGYERKYWMFEMV